MVIISAFACTKDWDDHYKNGSGSLNNDYTETLDYNITEFFNQHTQFSEFREIYKDTGMEDLFSKDQVLTLWVMDNDALNDFPVKTSTYDSLDFVNLHTSLMAWKYDDLYNNLQIISWSGNQAIKVSLQADGYLYLNYNEILTYDQNTRVIKSYLLNDGNVINVVSNPMTPTDTIYDYFKRLREETDEYSLILDSIFAYEEKEFDEENSKRKEMNEAGQWTYDTVWKYSNSRFSGDFNVMDPTKDVTVFLPSNRIVQAALDEALDMFEIMRPYDIFDYKKYSEIYDWIINSIFFNASTYFPQEQKMLGMGGEEYIWRTDIQQIDDSRNEFFNNGKIYQVTYLHIPKYYLIQKWYYDRRVENDKNAINMKYNPPSDGSVMGTLLHFDAVQSFNNDPRKENALNSQPGDENYGWWTFFPDVTDYKSGNNPNWKWIETFNNYTWLSVFHGIPSDWNQGLYVEYPLTYAVIENNTVTEINKMILPAGEYNVNFGGHPNTNETTISWFIVELNGVRSNPTDLNTYMDHSYGTAVVRAGNRVLTNWVLEPGLDNEELDERLRDNYNHVYIRQEAYQNGPNTNFHFYQSSYMPTENNY